jgi:hypothetical protein
LQPLFQPDHHFYYKRKGSRIRIRIRACDTAKNGAKKTGKMDARHAYARGPGRLVTLAVQGDHVTGDPLLSTMPAQRESKLAQSKMEVAKLLAHLLATAALWVCIQMSYKNQQKGDIAKKWPTKSCQQKNQVKNPDMAFRIGPDPDPLLELKNNVHSNLFSNCCEERRY